MRVLLPTHVQSYTGGTAELDLPTFDEWSGAYVRDPAQFDDELLGLWRERLKK